MELLIAVAMWCGQAATPLEAKKVQECRDRLVQCCLHTAKSDSASTMYEKCFSKEKM